MDNMTWINGYCSMNMNVVSLLEQAEVDIDWTNVKGERCTNGFWCPNDIARKIERIGGSPYYPARLELRPPA